MNDQLKNDGIFEINAEKSSRKQEATYIVAGVPRSGTSMVAMALKEMGINIGSTADNVVFEDLEVANALENNPKLLTRIIKERNSEHSSWGFKRPSSYQTIGSKVRLFRNPHFIVTFRDPVAIAKRNSISMLNDFTKGLVEAHNETGRLLRFTSELKVPVLLVSYEKSVMNNLAFIKRLSQFTGRSLTESKTQQIADKVINGPSEYLHSSTIKIEGRLERIVNGHVTGWARVKGTSERPIVVLSSMGREIGRTHADEFRGDLKVAKIGDGKFGFKIKVVEGEKFENLSANIQPYGVELIKLPN